MNERTESSQDLLLCLCIPSALLFSNLYCPTVDPTIRACMSSCSFVHPHLFCRPPNASDSPLSTIFIRLFQPPPLLTQIRVFEAVLRLTPVCISAHVLTIAEWSMITDKTSSQPALPRVRSSSVHGLRYTREKHARTRLHKKLRTRNASSPAGEARSVCVG